MSKLLFLLPVVLLLVVACGEEEPVKPNTPPLQINGVVQRSNDSAIIGAEVSLVFHTVPAVGIDRKKDEIAAGVPVCYPNPIEGAAAVTFDVSDAQQPVSLLVLDPLSGGRTATLINSVLLQSGQHTVNWNRRLSEDPNRYALNGRYLLRLTEGGTTTEQKILVNSYESGAFAVSDSSGRFFIDYDYIPVGYVFEAYDAVGNALGRRIVTEDVTMIIRKAPQFPDKFVELTIDMKTPQNVNIVMP